jgi:hypothetical protein
LGVLQQAKSRNHHQILTPAIFPHTRLIDFGFSCHHASFSAGMSVPLLSVNLACLMALFRSDDLASKVLQEELTVLIKAAGKALLDPRLASSSSSAEPSKLDEATSTQMVRAINKVRCPQWTPFSASPELVNQFLLTFFVARRPSCHRCIEARIAHLLDVCATRSWLRHRG